ncbi:MAG TPA: DEAD/DEAH box helicase [Blastocatellia bacterium]|nr:DEAD/DEAH box helicase [Blastocatellia bacterium]
MVLDRFHPAVASWFTKQFSQPTEPQAKAWPAIKDRRHTLIAAPTGSGKTLSAFLAAIDDLARQGIEGKLEDATQVVYVSPLKALSNDIQRNLQQPLEGIHAELREMGFPEFEIRTLVRTGDTSSTERAKMLRRPPHIVVTTPESLYLLLTSEGGRAMLRTTRTLIVDEIHALVRDKRGSHLSLSVERLEELVEGPLVRIGLSATQRPIEKVAAFLVGAGSNGAAQKSECVIIDVGHIRKIDLAIELPRSPLEAVMSGEVWGEVYDRLAELITESRTTLVFVNTRRMAERVARHLAERIGEENITSHHGSLSRERRFTAEQRLKAGELRALVATASLELGIDIGAVDLVCQLGSTRSIATLLQRVGRSGHSVGGLPKGRLFPTSRDELVECAALIDAARRGELDHLVIPDKPLDILAQQIVAAVACEEWTEEGLFNLVRNAYPYRDLSREEFDDAVRMLAEGYTTRLGRRNAYLHHDAVNHRLRARKGARLTALTNGGAIPDTADYDVILDPEEIFIGTVNEDFAVESLAGDIFQLGNTSWRITRVEKGRVRVVDAEGQPPTIPFWLGEAPGRTDELSMAVSRIRNEITERSDAPVWLIDQLGIGQPAAEQLVEYLITAKLSLGVMPSRETLVLERFFDESGGTQLVIHSPFGSRLNRAWGLALRKRFCRKFNFELQAAATEDAIILSLSLSHSFPLEDVFDYLKSASVRDLLIQAVLDAPMFTARWRWNANRALAIVRRRGDRRIPPQLQRMESEDLLAAIFPDQVACGENIVGDREIPAHPLVAQTIRDCLEEAMDIDGLEALLTSIERGEKILVARDLREPSPLSQEILNARPYAYLDDAPLEERRTQAVMSRRWLDPETAADLGTLDQAAIDQVREEAWPQAESADELHDILLQLGFVTANEGCAGLPQQFGRETPQAAQAGNGDSGLGWEEYFAELVSERRAASLHVGERVFWVAAERLAHLLAVYPDAKLEPEIKPPAKEISTASPDEGLVEVLRGRLEAIGPATAESLAETMALPVYAIESALMSLESEGFIMRGRFTPGAPSSGLRISAANGNDSGRTEWCVRRLLARIHRYTLNRLRKEIEPVAPADFMRFLLTWQRVTPGDQGEGPESLSAIVDQLEGFEAAAGAWEGEILPARLEAYEPEWLDSLCLSGRIFWARMSPPKGILKGVGSGPVRSTPVALLNRKNLAVWDVAFPQPKTNDDVESKMSSSAIQVYEHLLRHGASFFADFVENTGLLKTQVEEALAELVAGALITADSFTGLRALLTPSNKRPSAHNTKRKAPAALFGMENAGRWSRVHRGGQSLDNAGYLASGKVGVGSLSITDGAATHAALVERIAWVLLRRYGVVFRKLMDREGMTLPWRELLRSFRRLEARGEIRGGRFVSGVAGEQFALNEAVSALRSVRRKEPDGALISVSAADPLNLVGIVLPGARVPVIPSNRILYRDGVPIAVLEAGQERYLVELEKSAQWPAKKALIHRPVPPQLKAYLGRSA